MSKVFITEYAQKALGDVVFVELPKVGAEISAGGELLKCIALPVESDGL